MISLPFYSTNTTALICAKSTREYPLHCRVYIEPAEGTKVINHRLYALNPIFLTTSTLALEQVVAPCKCKGSQRCDDSKTELRLCHL